VKHAAHVAGFPASVRKHSPVQHEPDALRLVHHHPGYLRLQARAFLRPAEEGSILAAAQAACAKLPGVRSWSQNAKTSSVVVQYDPGDIEADDILRHVGASLGLRRIERTGAHKRSREELVATFLDAVQAVNAVVSDMAGGRADLREIVPLALVATSAVSFVLHKNRGRLPTWSSALYHSYRIFMQWHRREVRAREREGRSRGDGAP
jgi:hypothetical protein